MEDLSRKRIQEVRQEMRDGKRDDKGYPDLLSLMREYLRPEWAEAFLRVHVG